MKQEGSLLDISWERPLRMNGIPSQYEIEFRKIESCISYVCKRSIPLSRPVSIIQESASGNSKAMEVTVDMKQELRLHYFTKYEVKVRESTTGGGWGPYSPTLLFKTSEGST